MNSEQVQKFFDELDSIQRKASGNARSGIFAKRAMDKITTGYKKDWTTKQWTPRENAEAVAVADKLIEMGSVEAVYGRGRSLLHTN